MCGRPRGFFYRPHALEIVIGANFRAKDVDDHIARIDENPIAGFHPVDRPRAVACLLESPGEVLGDRADVALRAAVGDDDKVGQ